MIYLILSVFHVVGKKVLVAQIGYNVFYTLICENIVKCFLQYLMMSDFV